jgi:hypothetical protein
MEVSVVKQERMQKNFVQKLESLRKLLNSRLPGLEGRHLLQIMGKLAHFHYDKKKYLIMGTERELYNLLIENGYNPFTVYRWLLLERVPTDIKFQIKQKKMSQKKAVYEALKRRQERFGDVTQVIRDYGLSLIVRM